MGRTLRRLKAAEIADSQWPVFPRSLATQLRVRGVNYIGATTVYRLRVDSVEGGMCWAFEFPGRGRLQLMEAWHGDSKQSLARCARRAAGRALRIAAGAALSASDVDPGWQPVKQDLARAVSAADADLPLRSS